MRAFATTSVAAALTLLGGPCLAQSTTPIDPKVAQHAGDLFRAGREAAEAGDDKTACDRFTESEQLQPAPGTQLNLGACEAKQGHLLAAREHFRKAGAAFKPDDRRRAVAVNSANDLTDRLPVLTVHLAAGLPAETQVTLEGAPLDVKVLEHGIELDPGKTKLVVNVPGHDPRPYEIDLKEAEKRELTVEAGDVGVSPPDATIAPLPSIAAHDDARTSTRKLEHTLGFVGVGAGGVGLVLGSVFGALALSEASAVKRDCSPTYACNAAGVSAGSKGSTDGIASTTAFIAGGVFAAAGVYLLVSTWGDPGPAATQGSDPSFVVRPLALRSGGGASGTWTF